MGCICCKSIKKIKIYLFLYEIKEGEDIKYNAKPKVEDEITLEIDDIKKIKKVRDLLKLALARGENIKGVDLKIIEAYPYQVLKFNNSIKIDEKVTKKCYRLIGKTQHKYTFVYTKTIQHSQERDIPNVIENNIPSDVEVRLVSKINELKTIFNFTNSLLKDMEALKSLVQEESMMLRRCLNDIFPIVVKLTPISQGIKNQGQEITLQDNDDLVRPLISNSNAIQYKTFEDQPLTNISHPSSLESSLKNDFHNAIPKLISPITKPVAINNEGFTGLFKTLRNKYTILMYGDRGIGKTTFINAFLHNSKCNSFKDASSINPPKFLIPGQFKISSKVFEIGENTLLDGSYSATKEATAYKIKVQNKTYCFIDSPGINDKQGIEEDERNINNMLEKYEKIDFICCCIAPSISRKTSAVDNLLLFLNKLKEKTSANIIFCCMPSKSVNFKDNNTLTFLKDEIAKQNLTIELNDNIFYIDNEPYLTFYAKYRGALTTTAKEEEDLEDIWKKSFKSLKEMVNYIQNT